MPNVQSDIEIDAPVERVYALFRNYERFPEWMDHIKEVRRLGTDRTHWVAKVAGNEVEWDATNEEEDNRRIAWNATGEAGQSGEVLFERLGPDRTKIDVRIDYTLKSDMKEQMAKVLGLDERALNDDLESFKELVEEERTPSTPTR